MKEGRGIGVGTLNISQLERRYIQAVLDSGRISAGPFVRRFERAFAELHARRHAVMMNSGTSALHVALAVLKEVHGWRDGDEVLVPALTFIATSNVVLHNNLTPVFVDVEDDYYGIDPAKIEERITGRTRAIMPVHLFGQSCDMTPVMDIARRHDLHVVEDSCEAMLSEYAGQPVGSRGDIACFSTYVAHLLVSGVGGLLCTNEEVYAVAAGSCMAHGRDSIYLSIDDDETSDDNQLRRIVERRFSFVRPGHSFRVTEFEGALALAQLERRDHLVGGRAAKAAFLTERLARYEPALKLPRVRPGSTHAWMMYPIVVEEGRNRDELVMHLERARIETRYLMPLLSQPVYRKLFGDLDREYPVAFRLYRQGFYVASHPDLTAEDLEFMAGTFDAYFAASHSARTLRTSGS